MTAGDSWKLMNSDHTLRSATSLLLPGGGGSRRRRRSPLHGHRHTTSLDGGVTVHARRRRRATTTTCGSIPSCPTACSSGNDGGIHISTDRGESWLRPRIPIAQMYHVYTDNQIPYFVYGNRQDGPSFRGPATLSSRGDIPIGAWHSVGGCESGFAIPDPVDNNIVWSGCYEGILERYDLATGHSPQRERLAGQP